MTNNVFILRLKKEIKTLIHISNLKNKRKNLHKLEPGYETRA